MGAKKRAKKRNKNIFCQAFSLVMETTDKIHEYNARCDYAVQGRKIHQEKKIEWA